MITEENLYKFKYIFYLKQGGYSFVWADSLQDGLAKAKYSWGEKNKTVHTPSFALCTEEIESKLDEDYYVNVNWINEIHVIAEKYN